MLVFNTPSITGCRRSGPLAPGRVIRAFCLRKSDNHKVVNTKGAVSDSLLRQSLLQPKALLGPHCELAQPVMSRQQLQYIKWTIQSRTKHIGLGEWISRQSPGMSVLH